jgi:pantoate--beta-alanine ligase
MGALHEGHLSLVRRVRREAGFVVVSVFVNPTQFGPNEDFAAYPRCLEKDRRLCEAAGVDVLFAPEVETMYPPGSVTRVVQKDLTELWEGARRPGHFDGVCTVCAKLFNMVQPDVACFGQKDFQQAAVIRRMVRDLNMPVDVVVCPTVREPDGLAMSSRNAYLSGEERIQAGCLSRALRVAEGLVSRGETRSAALVQAMEAVIRREPLARLDYVAVVHPETLRPVETIEAGAVALMTVRIGKTRLLDNAVLRPVP